MSRAVKHITWTAEELQQALFSTYPHQPTSVDPGMLVFSIGLSNTPIIGDLYDLYTGVTGYDPVTGQYLAGWERLANIAGAIPILGLSGANIRHGVHAAESLIDNGDEMAQFIGAAGKCRRNSFSEETPVATDEGAVPISEVDVGDRVLAWDELSDTAGYYIVSAAFSHVDATIVELTIDDETLKTTADHPFYVVVDAPWLAVGETEGRWVDAGDLQVGNAIQKADGTTGFVVAVKVVAQPQRMYNLTVAHAHTFFVGDGEWLVHNTSCPVDLFVFGNSTRPRSPRPGDFGFADVDPNQIILAQAPPAPHGASTFADPLGAPVSGHYHILPAGTELPNGIDIIADGSDVLPGSAMPPTHHTIYNTIEMTYGEFLQLFENLPWRYAGKKK